MEEETIAEESKTEETSVEDPGAEEISEAATKKPKKKFKPYMGYIWGILGAAAIVFATYQVTETLHRDEIRRLKGKQFQLLLNQAESIPEILPEIKSIREITTELYILFSRLEKETAVDFNDKTEVLGSVITLHDADYKRLYDLLTEANEKTRFKKTSLALRQTLEERYQAYRKPAEEALAAHQAMEKTADECLRTFKRGLARLKKKTTEDIQSYTQRLEEVHEFVNSPIKLDFDPQPDIEYLNRRISGLKYELSKLVEMETAIWKMKNST